MMQRMFAIALVLLTVACANPRSTVVPQDPEDWKKDSFVNAAKSLTDEEKELLTAYLARTKIGEALGGKGIPVGVTVAEAIDHQLKWKTEQEAATAKKKAEEDRLKAEAEAKRAEAQAKFDQLAVVLSSKELEPPARYSFGDYLLFHLGAKNNAAQRMNGFTGRFEFRDQFGDLRGTLRVKFEEPLQPGETKTWTERQYVLTDLISLKERDLGAFKVAWLPEVILYADGTKADRADLGRQSTR